jgi:luciferase family oxidoreductase group 1
MMTKLSVLDLMMIGEGKTFADTLADAATLARHVEQHGYQRYWIAEHHDLPGIASSATALLIGHLAASTSRLRVGAGGIMLPNHSPLMVAEQFATLETLYPGRRCRRPDRARLARRRGATGFRAGHHGAVGLPAG